MISIKLLLVGVVGVMLVLSPLQSLAAPHVPKGEDLILSGATVRSGSDFELDSSCSDEETVCESEKEKIKYKIKELVSGYNAGMFFNRLKPKADEMEMIVQSKLFDQIYEDLKKHPIIETYVIHNTDNRKPSIRDLVSLKEEIKRLANAAGIRKEKFGHLRDVVKYILEQEKNSELRNQ